MSDLFGEVPALEPYRMREPCPDCGHPIGRIVTKSGQDTVRCSGCDRYCYCAPKTETGRSARSLSSTHNGIKPKQRARILARDGWRCQMCGKTAAEDPGGLHVGHILSVKDAHELAQDPERPVVLTDREINDDENLVSMCGECNAGQGEETMPLRLRAAILRARVATLGRAERERKERRR